MPNVGKNRPRIARRSPPLFVDRSLLSIGHPEALVVSVIGSPLVELGVQRRAPTGHVEAEIAPAIEEGIGADDACERIAALVSPTVLQRLQQSNLPKVWSSRFETSIANSQSGLLCSNKIMKVTRSLAQRPCPRQGAPLHSRTYTRRHR